MFAAFALAMSPFSASTLTVCTISALTLREVMSSMLDSSVVEFWCELAVKTFAFSVFAVCSTAFWRQLWNSVSPPLTKPRVTSPELPLSSLEPHPLRTSVVPANAASMDLRERSDILMVNRHSGNEGKWVRPVNDVRNVPCASRWRWPR